MNEKTLDWSAHMKRWFSSLLHRPLNWRELNFSISVCWFFFFGFRCHVNESVKYLMNWLMSSYFECARLTRTHFIMALSSCMHRMKTKKEEKKLEWKQQQHHQIELNEIQIDFRYLWVHKYNYTMKSSSRCWTAVGGSRSRSRSSSQMEKSIDWSQMCGFHQPVTDSCFNAKKPTFFCCYEINALNYKLKQSFCCCCCCLIDSVRRMCDVCLVGWRFFFGDFVPEKGVDTLLYW